MNTVVRCLLLGMLLAATAQAQPGDDEELAALLALLDEETEIATQTRLNADYVPGVVTVLRGEDLAALGARHVLDGLALVPGVQAIRDDIGNATLRVRGIDFFENSGQVKVLVNGLSFARESSGQNGSLMLIPIEQVDRIEVIRGPGSEVHGDFAFAGLINIITRDDGNRAYLQTGEGGLRSGGVALSRGKVGDELRLSLGLSTYESDDLEAAEGTRFADEERYFAHFNLDYKDLSFKLSAVDRDAVQSGARDVLRPRKDEGMAAELRYRWSLPDSPLAFESWLNYADNDMENNGTLFFEGGRRELGTNLRWDWGRHRLLSQFTYGRRDYDGETRPRPMGGNQRPAFGLVDRDRRIASASLQDQIELDSLTLTIGARYDWLEGIDQRFTPRVAAVWRIDDRHALKTQYAEGFRSGTAVNEIRFGELGALDVDDQLDFETIKTFEAQYIYRQPDAAFKATVYRARVEDRIQIVFGGQGMTGSGFINFGTIDAQGVELEWWRQFGRGWRLLANLSYQDTDTEGSIPPMTDGPSFAQATWLGNVGVIARPWEPWTFGLHLNYVGDQTVLAGEKQDGFSEVNLSANYTPAWAEGLTFRLTAKNATEGDVAYAFFLPPGNVRTLRYDQRRLSLTVEYGW